MEDKESERSESGQGSKERESRRGLLPTTTAIDGFVVGLFVLAFLAALRETAALCLPVVIGALLALLLDPAVRAGRKIGLSRGVAAALVMPAIGVLLVLGLRLTLEPAQEYLAEAPRKLHRIEHRLERLMKPVEDVSEAAKQVTKITEMTQGEGETVAVSSRPSFGQSLFANTQSFLAGTVASLTLAFFFLSSGDTLTRRWADLLGDRVRFLKIARQIQRDVSGHLWTITLINTGLGTLVGLACWWSGLPNPVLWGLMAAILNYVPYLGAAVGVLIVAAMSLLTFDSPLQALQAPACYLALTALEGTLVTPMILGRRFSLHPAIVFLGLLFWSYIWGVAGALLAVPLLLVFKIVCDNVPKLQKLGRAMAR